MASPDKVAAVAELTERFTSSSGAMLTEYRGLSVKALKDLRRSLGDDATYAVSKNTLTTIAARDAGVAGVEEHLVGPTAIAFIDGDPVAVAKGLRDFARTHPLLVIKGGVLDGKPLSAEDVRKLADLESRDVLLAKLAGGMKGVLQQAIGLVSAPLSQAARLFAALQQAKETSEPAQDQPVEQPVEGQSVEQPAEGQPVEEQPVAADADPGPATESASTSTDAAPAADDN